MDDQKTIQELRKEWDGLKKSHSELGKFLSERSGLPGLMNMNLALEAADLTSNLKGARRMADKWLMSGNEYLGVVAILLLGRIIEHSPDDRENALPILEYAVINKRWRLREAVVLALRRIAASNPKLAASIISQWTAGEYPIMYAVSLEALSDKALLKKQPALLKSLRSLSIKAMAEVSFHPREDGEPMRLLKERLGESNAILAMHDAETFGLMKEWAKTPVLRPIIKASLSDKKIRRKYPDESADIIEYIETGGA